MSWTQDVDLKHSSVANDLVSDLGAVGWSFGCLVVWLSLNGLVRLGAVVLVVCLTCSRLGCGGKRKIHS